MVRLGGVGRGCRGDLPHSPIIRPASRTLALLLVKRFRSSALITDSMSCC